MDMMADGQSWNRDCSVNLQQHGEGSQQASDPSRIQLYSKPTTIPQQILWLPSIYDFSCNFCISQSPSKQCISCNCCLYSIRSHKVQTQILITTHRKCICICLLISYLTVFHLCWKPNFSISRIVLNPQC